jgi:arylsulfatase
MKKHPNILLITTDQQRGDCLGIDGNPVLKTPVLDGLAREGAYFTAAYSEAPVCVPMRSAWMTGTHPLSISQNRWRENPLPKEILTNCLGDAGYHCAVFGKRHFFPERAPYGFHEMKIHESGRIPAELDDDYMVYLREKTDWGGYSRGHGIGNNDVFAAPSFIPEPQYISSWVARETTEFIERHVKGGAKKPFFCWTSFNKPHSPYDPPAPYDRLYRPQDVPAPYLSKNGLADELPIMQQRARYYTWQTIGEGQMRCAKALYYGMITHIDVCIGRVIDALKKSNLREDTIILFTSDHGDLMGDHQQYFKSVFYEGSSRVPYIINVPEKYKKLMKIRRSGKQIDPVGISTLATTILDLAGVKKYKSMTADSLLPMLQGNKAPDDGHVFASYELVKGKHAHSAMVRWGDFKYIYWQMGDHRQLFNVKNDPGELVNLAANKKYAKEVERAHQLLEKRLAEYPSAREEILDNGKLSGQPFPKSPDFWPEIKGPWGRRWK